MLGRASRDPGSLGEGCARTGPPLRRGSAGGYAVLADCFLLVDRVGTAGAHPRELYRRVLIAPSLGKATSEGRLSQVSGRLDDQFAAGDWPHGFSFSVVPAVTINPTSQGYPQPPAGTELVAGLFPLPSLARWPGLALLVVATR